MVLVKCKNNRVLTWPAKSYFNALGTETFTITDTKLYVHQFRIIQSYYSN